MTFENPIWLIAGGAACAGLVALIMWSGKQRIAGLKRFAAGHLLGRLAADVSPGRRRVKAVLLVTATACLFAAMARPQWGSRWEEVHRRGIDILLALDTSRSMLAPDVAPDRLSRAKMGIYDFVGKLEGDRVGLMPFAGQAFLLCPMTLDYGAFRESLAAVDTNIIPQGGTDMAQAIRTAEAAFEKGTNHKILVMITDGEDLEGEVINAAKAAAEKGITIHTVGVGTPNGELIPLGGASFLKDESGNVVQSRLDEDTLREIAEITGGVYAPLGDRGEGLDTIYAEKLALVPKEDLAQRTTEVKIDRFEWPLGLAILLLVIEFGLGTAKRRRSGVGSTSGVRRGVAGTAAVVAAFGMVSFADASEGTGDARVVYNGGTDEYAGGDWEAAQSSFEGALDTSDVELQGRAYYNLGNTLYRQGEAQIASGETEAVMERWENAIARYDAALALNAEDEDARYNKAFVEKKLEELQQQQQQEQQQEQDQQQENQESQDSSQDGESGESDSEPQESEEESSGGGENEQESPEESSDGSEESESEQNESSGGSDESSESEESSDGDREEPANQEENPSGSGDESSEREDESSTEESPSSAGVEEEAEEEESREEEAPGDESAGQETGEEEEVERDAGGEATDEESASAAPEGGLPEDGEATEDGSDARGVADQYANPDMTPRVPGEMSEEEAVQLLESLENETGEFQPLEMMRPGAGVPYGGSPKRDW